MRLITLLRRLFRASSAPRRSAPTSDPRHPRRPPVQPAGVPPAQSGGAILTQKRILTGPCFVIDGDTIIIDGVRLRLYGIDAPEMNHPWGKRAKWAVVEMTRGHRVRAELLDDVSYDRCVARCYLPDGRDIGAELVGLGLALDWPKFSGGCYRHLEPEGVRRKLWRADARQKGRMPPEPAR